MKRELSLELLKIQMINRRINYQGNGNFREKEVYSSSARTNYRFLKPELIQEFIVVCLDNFYEMYINAQSEREIAKSFAYFWQTFISIHPFTNGNGRTAKEYLKLKAAEKGYKCNFAQLDQVSFDRIDQDTLGEYSQIFEGLLVENSEEDTNIHTQSFSALS